jgi:hypothetical protein
MNAIIAPTKHKIVTKCLSKKSDTFVINAPIITKTNIPTEKRPKIRNISKNVVIMNRNKILLAIALLFVVFGISWEIYKKNKEADEAEEKRINSPENQLNEKKREEDFIRAIFYKASRDNYSWKNDVLNIIDLTHINVYGYQFNPNEVSYKYIACNNKSLIIYCSNIPFDLSCEIIESSLRKDYEANMMQGIIADSLLIGSPKINCFTEQNGQVYGHFLAIPVLDESHAKELETALRNSSKNVADL